MIDLSYNKTVTLAHIISVCSHLKITERIYSGSLPTYILMACEKVNKYFFFGEVIFSFSM